MSANIFAFFPKGLVCLLTVFVIFGSIQSPAVLATPTAPKLILVRTLETKDVFGEAYFSAGSPPHFSGVGFPPGAHTLLMINQPTEQASLVLTSPPKNHKDAMALSQLEISDPINIAFDSVSRGAKGFGQARLFLLDANHGELITIQAGPQDIMEPSSFKRFDAHGFGIVSPQGMTVEPATGRLWVLESAGTPQLVSIQPKPGHQFAEAEISQIYLPTGLGKLRGIAFNPADGHIYMLSTEQQKLYKLNVKGELVTSLDFSGSPTDLAQGLVFAPSLDGTDHPSIYHLYLVTDHGPEGEISEWALPGPY